ncbi:MAG TPA: OmpA family protein [Arachnia sp.]|nr:OmpA family protein [Arachnia sp.]HMT86574.1 OmpA family protein [Arachnia sp.]
MKRHSLAAALTPITIVAGLTGCGHVNEPYVPEPTPALTTDGIVVVAASHANVPMLRLSRSNSVLAGQVLDARGEIQVVSADGTPERAAINIPKVEAKNPTARTAERNTALTTLNVAVTVEPNANEVSAYAAMEVARDMAADMGLRRPTFICLGCGLDTTGPLSMTTENALLNEPADVVDRLTASAQLVDFTGRFDEVTVHLTAMGYVAGTQEPLPMSDRTRLVEIWTAVLEAGGATVVDIGGTLEGDPIDTNHTVTPVTPSEIAPPPPPPPPCTAQQHVFDGASGARFVAETDRWVDVAEARAALQPLATWLAEDPARTARIQGTTADIHSGREDEGVELSLSRARAAAALLIDLGATPEQIVSVEGFGPNYPGYVADHDAAGHPVPHLRSKNRKVLVTLDDPC